MCRSEFIVKFVFSFSFSKAQHFHSHSGSKCASKNCVRTLSSSHCLSPVSSGGAPGPLKPVLPPQPLPVSQPHGGASQAPPTINTAHPYQVKGTAATQRKAVWRLIPATCFWLRFRQRCLCSFPKTFSPALSSFNLLTDRIPPPWLLLRWLHRWPWRQPTARRVAVSYWWTLWAFVNNLC